MTFKQSSGSLPPKKTAGFLFQEQSQKPLVFAGGFSYDISTYHKNSKVNSFKTKNRASSSKGRIISHVLVAFTRNKLLNHLTLPEASLTELSFDNFVSLSFSRVQDRNSIVVFNEECFTNTAHSLVKSHCLEYMALPASFTPECIFECFGQEIARKTNSLSD